jgi:heat shock protein HslJ
MNEQQSWLKIGILAIAGVGFLAIIGVALAAGDDLGGTTWVVDEFVVDGTSVEPLAGTELSALFDDGNVNGVAGCNSYFASYEVDGGAIAIGPAGSTMAFCVEPEGIMEQEIAYLTLLGTVDSFARDGDQLKLRQGDDVLITYGAANSK